MHRLLGKSDRCVYAQSLTPIESTAELTFVWLKIVCVAFEHGFSWLDITSHNILSHTVFDGSKPGDLTRSEESYISSESCHTSECRKSGYNKRPIVVSAKPVGYCTPTFCVWRTMAGSPFSTHYAGKGDFQQASPEQRSKKKLSL